MMKKIDLKNKETKIAPMSDKETSKVSGGKDDMKYCQWCERYFPAGQYIDHLQECSNNPDRKY